MKIPAATLAALLLVAMCQGAEAQLDSIPTSCCFSYVHRTIPRSVITSAYMTSSRCHMPGVILVTKKQMKVCADPQEPWVQRYLKYFQILKN
ncbi:CCL3 protein, partial [Bucorvus abyssinicus]|nr:CCL3 protein [Bucorvus abyssinicus]